MKLTLNKKILLLIDNWFIHFGIAKHLQSFNFDLYAIIDTDKKAKKFYEKQDIVKFSKEWYLSDHVSAKLLKPDLNYLKSFEKKYGINIWEIAFTDRAFYQYNPNYKFTSNEILCIIEQECKFYEKVLDEVNPDCIFLFFTIHHYQHLLHQLCKAKKIPILMFSPVRFGNRMMISQEGLKIDDMENFSHDENISEKSLDEYLDKFNPFKQLNEVKKISFESHTWERYLSNLKFFARFWQNDYKDHYSNYGKTRSKILFTKISRSINRKRRQYFLDNNLSKKIDENQSFVYFPLHYQPERVLLFDAPFYDNQISIIISIAKSLPIDHLLYVKEHPLMGTIGWRELSFYKKIMDIPNVKLIHPSVKPAEILSKSSLIITIAGTTGLEAAFYNKPSIVFTDQFYSELSFVYRLKNIGELANAIKESIDKSVNKLELAELIQKIDQHSFEFNMNKFATDFAYRFGYKGPIMESKLSIDKIKEFLEENSKTLEDLTNRHIKKLEQFSK